VRIQPASVGLPKGLTSYRERFAELALSSLTKSSERKHKKFLPPFLSSSTGYIVLTAAPIRTAARHLGCQENPQSQKRRCRQRENKSSPILPLNDLKYCSAACRCLMPRLLPSNANLRKETYMRYLGKEIFLRDF
jgi:hypothetical protein